MNREFLKNAGVPDEAIDKIMAEHGKDIQAEKDKAAKSSRPSGERKRAGRPLRMISRMRIGEDQRFDINL